MIHYARYKTVKCVWCICRYEYLFIVPIQKITFLNIQVKCTSSILQVIYLQFQVQTPVHLAVEHSFSFSSFEPAVILQTAEKKTDRSNEYFHVNHCSQSPKYIQKTMEPIIDSTLIDITLLSFLCLRTVTLEEI